MIFFNHGRSLNQLWIVTNILVKTFQIFSRCDGFFNHGRCLNTFWKNSIILVNLLIFFFSLIFDDDLYQISIMVSSLIRKRKHFPLWFLSPHPLNDLGSFRWSHRRRASPLSLSYTRLDNEGQRPSPARLPHKTFISTSRQGGRAQGPRANDS